jgi:hypothetical protein
MGWSVHNEVFQLIVQALSTLAVAGGLIYAALQFRGWRTAQYVTNFTELVKLQLELRKMVVEDPTLATAGLDIPPGTRPEDIRSDYYNLMQLSLFEIAWFSHLKGELTDDYFNSWVTNMTEVARRPAFYAMWQSDRTKIMHAGFRQYMNAFMEHTVVLAPVSRSGPSDEAPKT